MKLLTLLGLLCFCQSYYQVDCTGLSYALTCGALYAEDFTGDCVVMINSNVSTTATIRTYFENIVLDVEPGATTTYSMGGSYSVTEGIEEKTFYVDSSDAIDVHVSNEGNIAPYYVLDAVEAQAVTDVDTEHYVINYGDGYNDCPGNTAFYTVAALNGITTVSIYERTGEGLTLRTEVDLNRFQCFSERADISGSEPTGDGFVIRSSAPVSLYSGNRCAREETDTLYHSTWSSIPSVSYLGTNYVTYPFTTAFDSPGGSYGVKVVATQNNTMVSTSLGQSGTIDQGESTFVWYEYGTGEHVGEVVCSNPCLVLQMVNGTSLDAGVSQTIIMPDERMITFGAFSTPDWQRSTVNHYLHLIHPTGDGVSLDGSSLDSEGWESHAGFQYLEYQLSEGYHEVSSTSAAFSALVSGLTTGGSGYMMNVDTDVSSSSPVTTVTPPGTTTPPGNSTAPQPQKVIPLDGVFYSASGEDFTLECSGDYNDALQSNVEMMASTVNSMIGVSLCTSQTLSDMQVVTHTSTFTPSGSDGTNRISYYLLVGLDQTESDAEACASEISSWLIPHENWQEIVPVLPDCPEVVFTADEWSHAGNDWVCYSQLESDSAPAVFVTSLTYDLEMSGRFDTESGEVLTAACTETYTESLLQATINQRTEVNALLGSTLCSGMSITIGVPSARLNTVGSTGETYQDYPFELSSLSADTMLRDVTDCVSEVSAYLAPHSNWPQPIIPPATGCPTLVFQDEQFVEETQRWVCVQE